MKVSPVRDLARRYASGQLSQENYRSQRRLLIDAITTDAEPLTYREERAPAFGKHGRMKIALVAAVVVLVGVIFLLVLKTTAAKHASSPPPLPVAAKPAPDPGQELIHGFVETNDWTDPSLLDFLHRWQTLAPTAQEQARKSSDFTLLVSGLRQQITSEKALAKLAGPTNTDLHLVNLQKMAELLGQNGKG